MRERKGGGICAGRMQEERVVRWATCCTWDSLAVYLEVSVDIFIVSSDLGTSMVFLLGIKQWEVSRR